MKAFIPLLLGALFCISCIDRVNELEISAPTVDNEKKIFNEGSVFADNNFDGGRINDFKRINDSTYQVLINPENTPVNSSPWFAFRIWSEKAQKVVLNISYSQGYKHRYIPKLSTNGTHWTPADPSSYQEDATDGNLILKLQLGPEKLWVSAQENLNSFYINSWMDSLAKKEHISIEHIGNSVLGQHISLLRVREAKPAHSIILIGRQHPPEVPGGTISLMSFVQTILSDTDVANRFRDRFEILVFPLLNPDGVDNGNWRHNANGEDLNRDWISFRQPETRAVRNLLLSYKNSPDHTDYRFGIDFHTSFSGPYLLTLDTIPQNVHPEITNKWIAQIESNTNEKLDIRPRAQSLPYCYNWMINELEIEAVTYEEGDEIDRKVVKKRASDYANSLMRVLME